VATLHYQRTGKTAYEAISEILADPEMSFRIWYDLPKKLMYFEVYQGLDRTSSQNVNTWCVFAKERYNVTKFRYTNNRTRKNFAFVAGEDRGDARATVIVDQTDGAARKELFVDARDLQKAQGTSESAYLQLLQERGLSKLAEYNIGEAIECTIDSDRMGNMAYGLGDKCSFSDDEIDLYAEGRITEIQEIVENQTHVTKIILGKEQLTVGQKITRSIQQ